MSLITAPVDKVKTARPAILNAILTVMEYIFYFLIAAIIFAGIDLVWLGFIAKNFYRKELGGLFAKKVVIGPAIAFYILYIIGLLFFALNPALINDSVALAARYGAVFGLIAYATYDLTNWATLNKWPGAKLSIVDMIWGGFLTGSTTLLTFLIVHNW